VFLGLLYNPTRVDVVETERDRVAAV
jgi:hypothetical protein